MKRLLTLTLFALLAISCSHRSNGIVNSSKGAGMTHSVGTQAELDAANQRVTQYRQELMQRGFREVSVSFHDKSIDTSLLNSKEEFVLEGQQGRLKDLRVTLWTTRVLQKGQPQLGGDVHASISDDQADREFQEFYKQLASVVTGHIQTTP